MDKIREAICRGIVYSDRDAVYGTQRPAGGRRVPIRGALGDAARWATRHAGVTQSPPANQGGCALATGTPGTQLRRPEGAEHNRRLNLYGRTSQAHPPRNGIPMRGNSKTEGCDMCGPSTTRATATRTRSDGEEATAHHPRSGTRHRRARRTMRGGRNPLRTPSPPYHSTLQVPGAGGRKETPRQVTRKPGLTAISTSAGLFVKTTRGLGASSPTAQWTRIGCGNSERKFGMDLTCCAKSRSHLA